MNSQQRGPDTPIEPGPGQLFVIAAPSGAGKTSLVAALMAREPTLSLSVSHTTRTRRQGEIDGEHYHFVDEQQFLDDVAAGDFLEHARVFDRYYGTRRSTVNAALGAGQELILEIDWQGAAQVQQQYPDCCSIFILPPGLDTLRQRLISRGQDSGEVIERRMREAAEQISHYHQFDYVVVNDTFDHAVDSLQHIVHADRLRLSRQRHRLHEPLEAMLNSR